MRIAGTAELGNRKLALRDAALARLAQLSRAEVLEPYLTPRLTKSGESVEVSIVSTALVNAAGEMYAVATTERARTGDPP